MKFRQILTPFAVSLILFSGCTNYITYESEIVSSRVQMETEERLERENPDIEHQNINLLGKSAAFFFVVRGDKKISDSTHDELETRVYNNIEKTDFYPDLKNGKQIASILKQHLTLNQLKNIYLDSISTVAVSDKDISNPLGKVLKVDNLVIFQIDNWPKKDQTESDTLKMKMRIVNAESGKILWTALHVMEQVSTQPGTLQDKVDYVTNTLTESFYNRFEPKWHKQRFLNLAKI